MYYNILFRSYTTWSYTIIISVIAGGGKFAHIFHEINHKNYEKEVAQVVFVTDTAAL